MATTPVGYRKSNEPKVYGAADAAAALGVEQSNLRTVAGIEECIYQNRDDGCRATTLYRATDVDRLADEKGRRRQAEDSPAPAPAS
jgi:hypothetical protein